MRGPIRLILLMLADAMLVNIALFSSLLLRFEGIIPKQYLDVYINTFFVITVIRICSLYFFKLYNRIWQYASVNELITIVKAVTVGSIFIAFYLFIDPNNSLPRSVFILSWMLNILFVGGSRFAWRIYVDSMSKKNKTDLKRVLIIGAGDAGAMVAREMKNSNLSHAIPVGFIDDDDRKHRMQLHEIPVLGDRKNIPAIVKNQNVDEVIIAMPSVSRVEIREIVNICKQTKAKLKTLPGIYELIDGKVKIEQIRDVQVEDLLGREPIKLDIEGIAQYLKDRVVLVTGAGGSIGSELCRQIVRFDPKTLVLLDNNENNVYDVELELKNELGLKNIAVEIADIKDKNKINYIFQNYKPCVVFHAAAHKHVPLMETNPEEAIKNNVFGTKNVAEAADRVGTDIFLLISTDKAVHPTSYMGASKRIAEMVIQSMDKQSKTRFVAVRFGNVLGSRGSVIPIFKRQIAMGGPVTVTDPEMVRFFMTIPEAVQLVIQTGALAKGRETFVLDMGEAVRIYDLASDLISLSGLELGKDIEIVFSGIRPGEKLYEEILTAEEGTLTTEHERIYVAKPVQIDVRALHETLYQFLREENLLCKDKLEDLISSLVPTFRTKLPGVKKEAKKEVKKQMQVG